MDFIREDDFKITLGTKNNRRKLACGTTKFDSNHEKEAQDRLKATKTNPINQKTFNNKLGYAKELSHEVFNTKNDDIFDYKPGHQMAFDIENRSLVNSDDEFNENFGYEKPEDYFELVRKSQYNMSIGRHLNHVKTIDLDGSITSLKFNKSDRYQAAGMANGKCHIVNVEDGESNLVFDTGIEGISCTGVYWRPTRMYKEEAILTTNCDGTLTQFSMGLQKAVWKKKEPNTQFQCGAYKPSGNAFVVGDQCGNIWVYDEETRKLLHKYERGSSYCPGHTSRIFSIKMLENVPFSFISGGWDNSVQFWDLREKKPFGSYFGQQISGDTLDEKNNTILVGNSRGSSPIDQIDFGSKTKIGEVPWYESDDDSTKNPFSIYCSQYSKKEKDEFIVAGSANKNGFKVFEKIPKSKNEWILSWSAEGLQKGIYCCDISHSNSQIAFGGAYDLQFLLNSRKLT